MMTLIDRRRLMFAALNKYLPATEQIIKQLRRTANGATIGDGVARISEIKGNSLVWNQLVDTSITSVDTISGRKYYTFIGGTASIVTGDGTPLSVTSGVDMVTDLTLLFGGSVPSGYTVADFQSVFPLPYYDYNPGEIINTTCAKTERVMWNQKVKNGNFADGTTNWTAYSTSGQISVENGVLTLTCKEGYASTQLVQNDIGLLGSHQIYCSFEVFSEYDNRIRFGYAGQYPATTVKSVSGGVWTKISQILTTVPTTVTTLNIYPNLENCANSTHPTKFKNIFILDLTLMFGEGNEPTLQECEAIFTEDYYTYDAGTQKTLTLEDGGIESRDSNNILIATLHTKLTTMKGKLNGVGESVVVFPDGPARAGTVYDQVIVDNDGWCRRVRKNMGKYVFTGKENVTLAYSTNVNGYKVLIPGGITGYTYTDIPLCSKYNSLNAKAFNLDNIDYDKTVYRRASQSAYIFNDSSIADVTAFKVAIVGVELLYQLATPEEYILDEPIFLGYITQNGGTENIIPLDTQDRPAVALIAEIRYRKP